MWIVVGRQKALLLSCLVLVVVDADRGSREQHRTKRSEVPCAVKYQVMGNHTACLPRSKNNPGVSEADKKIIVDMHNEKRSSVNPEATNMLRMSWDDEVAMIAQKWADNCDTNHEKNNLQRVVPGRFSVGQNIATGAQNWSHAINMWHEEVKDFEYGNKESMSSLFLKIGHYTQMVWAETNKIGCGFSVCNEQNFHVCNYAPSGNLQGSVHVPYKSGPSCSECQQGKCSDKLCDCGFTCLNGGTINTTDCTCKCLNDFFLEPVCRLKCKEQEQEFCRPGIGYSSSSCEIVLNNCPVRCRLCPYAEDGYSGSEADTAKSTARSTSPACSCWSLLLLKVLVVIFCKNFT